MMHQRQQQVSMNPVVTSIKRSIYTHVNELIAQNEERPEQLARIYHNLQNINYSTEIAMANLNNSTLSSSGGGVGAGGNHNRRPPWGSMYRDVEDDDLDDLDDEEEEEENNVVTSSTSLFKNIKTFNAAVLASSSSISTPATNDNRLALLAASSAADVVNSSGESSLIQEEEHQQQQQDRFPLFSYEVCSILHTYVMCLQLIASESFCNCLISFFFLHFNLGHPVGSFNYLNFSGIVWNSRLVGLFRSCGRGKQHQQLYS